MTEAHSTGSHEVVYAEILPNWLNDGEPVTIRVAGLADFAGSAIDAHVSVLDDAEIWWHTAITVEVGQDGRGEAVRDSGLSVGRHAAVYVGEVTSGAVRIPLENVLISIVNSPVPGNDLNEVTSQFEALRARQTARYDQPIGLASPDSLEHRALCLLEGVLTTTQLRFPGSYTMPVSERLKDLERLVILNGLLEGLAWDTRVPEEPWIRSTSTQLPMTALVIPQIWAGGFEEAAELARDVQSRVLSVLGLNRNASGSPVALVIEQRQPADGVKYRVFPPHRPYSGNLVGGPLSGESQRQIAGEYAAIDQDPLIHLCCELYLEALQERSEDARFLRLWSILELLSGARVPGGMQVPLQNGQVWPGAHNTTSYAAPRVYHYLVTLLFSRSIDTASFVSPATDLYQAVRAWYGRRNATGHYGRLVPGDSRQVGQGWYSWALLTATDEWQWISTLKRIVEAVLRAELAVHAKLA